MNNLRRKMIYDIIKMIAQLLQDYKDKSSQTIDQNMDQIINLIQFVLDDEEMCKDNIPENLQNSSRYEISEAACENLDNAISLLEDIDFTEEDFVDVVETIKEALEYLNEAAQ